MRIIFALVLSCVLVWSCKSKSNATHAEDNKNSTKDKNPKDANSSLPIMEKIQFYQAILKQPEFERIKISSKLDVETGGFMPTLDVTTYIEKDQKIWMNLSAYFYNAARGIATPEGFKALNRTDKTYIDSDFNYLNKLLNVNFIDYKSLEKLLMGRTFIRINDSEFFLSKNGTGYKVNSLINQKTISETGEREYKVELRYNSEYDLTFIQLNDAKTSDEIQITYESWENYQNFRMPKNVKIIIKGSKNSQILMENTKFDDSKIQTPFSVPASYKKIEI